MQKDVPIPVKAYAIAAYSAARFLREDPADVFDDTRPSRARFIAVTAMRRVFPRACASHMAAHLGFCGDSRDLSRALYGAQTARWWLDIDVDRVVEDLRAALATTARSAPGFSCPDLATIPAPAVEPEPGPRQIAAGFRARIGRPTPVLSTTRRPALATAALLGDPPPGRREFLASLESPEYSAMRDDPKPRKAPR